MGRGGSQAARNVPNHAPLCPGTADRRCAQPLADLTQINTEPRKPVEHFSMSSTTPAAPRSLQKSATGIRGLDDITFGGLPTGRPTLVCGAAGCGKTLMAMEFLLHGAVEHGEPGVFLALEERPVELMQNMTSLGVDLDALVRAGRLAIDHLPLDEMQFEAVGDFNLEGLFVRLGHAVTRIGARRVAIDTLETLFASLPNEAVIRTELRRLFRWLKDRGLTAVITAERGEHTLTRFGIEEYVSDCVIVLDNRVVNQTSTRRLRVLKYRGSAHGANEYPFLIDAHGISVQPITSARLDYAASQERVSCGIDRLDAMLGGAGVFRGSSVLVSGTAGCGKSSLTAHFVDAACRRGERAMMLLFEEAPAQVMRNMRAIGIDLQPWADQGLLEIHAARPTLVGLEMHLMSIVNAIEAFRPSVVTVDPISAFGAIGDTLEIKAMLLRLMDHLKKRGITVMLTSLTHAGQPQEMTDQDVSSLIDTWIVLRDIEFDGERNRGLYILKSRGMPHSHQIREFAITDHGFELRDVYLGRDGFLTGSARTAREAHEQARAQAEQEHQQQMERTLARRREAMDSRIAALRAEFAAEEAETRLLLTQDERRHRQDEQNRDVIGRLRGADPPAPHGSQQP